MKKSLIVAVAIVVSSLSLVWAGHFIDVLPPASAAGCVPVSNGYDYNCTNDTSAPSVKLTNQLSMPTYSLAIATTSLIAPTTGSIIVVTSGANATAVTPCISTGSTTTNQYVLIIATGTVCK